MDLRYYNCWVLEAQSHCPRLCRVLADKQSSHKMDGYKVLENVNISSRKCIGFFHS